MTIFGTNGDDVLTGTSGNDVINALEGVDRVVYDASYTDVRLFYTADGFIVNARRADEGLDVVRNAERFDFGDGVTVQLTTDANGAPMTMAVDHDDAHEWARIRTKYDDDGKMLSHLQEFDDGTARIVLSTYRPDGSRDQVIQIDGPNGHAGNRPWDSRVSNFDDDGRLAERVTTFDSGSVFTQHYEFEGGRLFTRTDHDGSLDGQGNLVAGSGARAWATRETTFDELRRIESVATEYDDGAVRTESREYDLVSGRLSERTTFDGELVDGPNGQTLINGNAGWAQQTVTFDDDGRTQGVITTFDDGRQLTKAIVRIDGEIAYRVDYDGVYDQDSGTYVNDGVNWATKVFSFENGAVSRSTVTMDNDDTIEMVFASFGVEQRKMTDESDTRDWHVRTVDYDADGNRTTTYEWDDGTFSTV